MTTPNDINEPSLALARSMAWIPSSERLPPEGVLVFAYGKRAEYGFRRDGKWVDTLYGGVLANEPTHWMPLPAPPSDGK
jgi:hypothetical protein